MHFRHEFKPECIQHLGNTTMRSGVIHPSSTPNIRTAVQAVISHANTYLGYAFVNDGFTYNSCAMPGEDERAVQEFLEFVRTQTDVVRIECTALHTPGEWPRVAEFRVESRNDDGGTEIVHWSVQKARV